MNNFIQDINKLNNNKSIDKKEDNYFNSLANETFSRNEKNSDVINISELSKIKLEYERDDVKMNNGQFNNNFGQPELNQGPAFGGRFFPSLEDEPTNMNMMGGLNNGPSAPVAPVAPAPMGVPTQPNMNNNLIDLTDLSIENEPSATAMPAFGTNQNPAMSPIEQSVGISTPLADINIPRGGGFGDPISMPSMNQPMNIPSPMSVNEFNSVPNNNSAIASATEPVSMDILNSDFGAPQQMPNFGVNSMPTTPEPIGMSTPSIDTNIPQGGNFGEPMSVPNYASIQQPMMEIPKAISSFGPTLEPPMPSMPEPMEMPTSSIDMNMSQGRNFNEPMTIPNFDTNVSIPSFDNNISMPNLETNTVTQKDVTPVTNTIKNLVNNLTEFGYKINIIEDDLINVSKLVIEIEK